jgi:nucleoporin SEH1
LLLLGNLIASCSEDRTIGIWEEQLSVTTATGGAAREKWSNKFRISDCKKAVNDVKFAPKHLGLKIAAACADGAIRIYEGEVFSLNSWIMQHTLQVEETVMPDGATTLSNLHSEHGLTCLAWSDCVFEQPRIAVGGYSRRAVVWVLDGSSGGGTGKWREVSL